MKINDKDRSQLLRMAGNIACGLVADSALHCIEIAEQSATIALATLRAVDNLIELENKYDE